MLFAFFCMSMLGKANDVVFRVNGDSHYHYKGCPRIKKAFKMTLEETRIRGLKPCEICKPESDDPYRCKGRTQKGRQCKKNAKEDKTYCWQHQATSDRVDQCQGKNRSGKRCKNRAKDGSTFCHLHLKTDTQETKGLSTSGRCQGITKAKRQCKRRVKAGKRFCYQHD